jgi:hypothetical protein
LPAVCDNNLFPDKTSSVIRINKYVLIETCLIIYY